MSGNQKNTGKDSEDIFQEKFASFGKKVYLWRITDTFEASRGNKIKVQLKKTPADFIMTWEGVTAFAEVKSCSHKTSFPFKNFTVGQMAAMKRQRAAGGKYWVFIHRLETDEWYWIYGDTVLDAEKKGKSSLNWDELGWAKYNFANYGADEDGTDRTKH